MATLNFWSIVFLVILGGAVVLEGASLLILRLAVLVIKAWWEFKLCWKHRHVRR